MRRRVNAGRASTRRSVQIVMGITVVFVLGLTLFNRSYVEPYSGTVGQVVLLLILSCFAAGFAWMRRLAAFEVPERFLFSRRATRPVREGRTMTTVMLVGACVGLGMLLLVLQFDTGRASGASELARLDAARARTQRTAVLHEDDDQETRVDAHPPAGRAGPRRSSRPAAGTSRPGMRADLAVVGGTVEGHLGMSVLAGVAGLFAPTVMLAPAIYFFGASISSPLWLALLGALIGAGAAHAAAAGQRQGTASRLPPRGQLLPRPGLDEPRRRPRRARGAAVGGQPEQRLGRWCGSARPSRTPACRASRRGRRWASSARRWRSRSCATSPPRSRWWPRTAPRCASRWPHGRSRCASASWPTPRAGAAQRSQSMLIAQLLLCVGFLLFLIYPPISQILGF